MAVRDRYSGYLKRGGKMHGGADQSMERKMDVRTNQSYDSSRTHQ